MTNWLRIERVVRSQPILQQQVSEEETSKGESKNGISSFLGSNKFIVALVVLTGGGNIWQTHVAEETSTTEIHRAIAEVHSLYGAINDALDRSKRVESKVDDLLKKN